MWAEMESESEDTPAEQAMELEQDAMHASNPQYCVEYVHEIFEHLTTTEGKLMPRSSYMDTVSCMPFRHPTLCLAVSKRAQALCSTRRRACTIRAWRAGVTRPERLDLLCSLGETLARY